MKILLTGHTGQLGYELERSLQPVGQVVTVGRAQMNLADVSAIRDVIRTVKPDLIVNPAAYTAVDRAEHEPEIAARINTVAPAAMAEEAHRLGAAMVHYSTDYVYDGRSREPYREGVKENPRTVYGTTKLHGEEAVAGAGIPHLIFRTSWLYGMRGTNFLLTIMRLASERSVLRIVADQYGAPTWCRLVADATAQILSQGASHEDWRTWWLEKGGIYALTCTGETSWHGFAQAIVEEAGLVKQPSVEPITTAEYPTSASRPAYSVLSPAKLGNSFGIRLPHWRTSLALCMGAR